MGQRSRVRGVLPRTPLVLVASVAGDGFAAAQTELWRVEGSDRVEHFGTGVAFVGDLDGDGTDDFAIGVPVLPRKSGDQGMVRIVSGGRLQVVREIVGDHFSFGRAIARAGDFDGDGSDDLAVGAPDEGDGAVHVVSLRTGATLASFAAGSAHERYGAALDAIGDVDGDGVPDLLVGAPQYRTGFHARGRVELRSGGTGAVLGNWIGKAVRRDAGRVVRSTGDFDGDGRRDVLFLEKDAHVDSLWVDVHSSATGARLLHQEMGSHRTEIDAFAGSCVDDADGDGEPDLVVVITGFRHVGAPLGWAPFTTATVFGTAGAWPIAQVDIAERGFAAACGNAGDLDGDGRGEFALGLARSWSASIAVHSAADGALQSSFDFGCPISPSPLVIEGAPDLDGDGSGELLVGMAPSSHQTSESEGKVELRSLATDQPLGTWHARAYGSRMGWVGTFDDDVDGDGMAELLIGEVTDQRDEPYTLTLRSSIDGSVLQRTASWSVVDALALALVPDVDGDGRSDYAMSQGALGRPALVEVRSGASGAVVHSFTDPRPGFVLGRGLAPGVQPSGAVELCMASEGIWPTHYDGEVRVVDLATGATVVQASASAPDEAYGLALAYVGDVDGDGVGDWLVGAPGSNKKALGAGRAEVVSGRDGSRLREILGAKRYDGLGTAVAAAPDVDGDGVADLLIGSPGHGANDEGMVGIYSGATGALLRSYPGPLADARFGSKFAPVADANGDGEQDLLVAWPDRRRVDLVDGATGRLTKAIRPSIRAERIVVAPPWIASQVGAHDGPLLAVLSPYDSGGGRTVGAVALLALDDLFLEIDPEHAAAGATVFASVRGGPPAAPAALWIEAIDGAPVQLLANLGAFNASGLFPTSAVVPPGLAGTVWSLRGYAIGFDGKVVDTRLETLAFE